MFLQPVLNMMTAAQPLLGGGGLPTLFSWNTETGQPLPSGTFTRASIKQEFDGTNYTELSSGAIPENSAAVGGGAKGFFPEPAATNLVIDSSDFAAASWSSDQITLADNGASALGLNETSMVTTTVNSRHIIFASIAGSGDRTVGVIAKAGASGGQYLFIRGDGNDETATFDLVNGLVTEIKNVTDAKIKDRGSGNYVCAMTDFFNVGMFAFVGITDNATGAQGNRQWLGAGEEIFNYHVQCENTLFLTSPIITNGGTETRSADVLDTDVVIASEFGAFLDLTLPDAIGTGNTITLLGPDATAEDILRVDAAGDVIMDDGGTPVTIGTATLGTRIKVSYGRDATGRSASLEGATTVTGGAPGAGHEGDSFQLGCANSVNQSRCIHHVTNIYSVRPTDSELEALSS